MLLLLATSVVAVVVFVVVRPSSCRRVLLLLLCVYDGSSGRSSNGRESLARPCSRFLPPAASLTAAAGRKQADDQVSALPAAAAAQPLSRLLGLRAHRWCAG